MGVGYFDFAFYGLGNVAALGGGLSADLTGNTGVSCFLDLLPLFNSKSELDELLLRFLTRTVSKIGIPSVYLL